MHMQLAGCGESAGVGSERAGVGGGVVGGVEKAKIDDGWC